MDIKHFLTWVEMVNFFYYSKLRFPFWFTNCRVLKTFWWMFLRKKWIVLKWPFASFFIIEWSWSFLLYQANLFANSIAHVRVAIKAKHILKIFKHCFIVNIQFPKCSVFSHIVGNIWTRTFSKFWWNDLFVIGIWILTIFFYLLLHIE